MTGSSLDVLRCLSDGEFHSGEALARDLGVSRGTVWNAVRGLAAAGLEVYSVPGRGYRLAHAVSLLDPQSIAQHAGNASARLTLELVDVTASTNTLLAQRAAAGAASGTVIAAECQERGRGRLGRQWHADLGGGITFSLLWRFEQGAAALAGLSLAAGVALVRALEQLGARDVKLKWPNDLLWGGGKLAGMLIEMQGDALGPSAVVIGMGLNVRLSEVIRSRIDQPVADLETACGCTLDRSAVLGAVLAELTETLATFEREGFAPLRPEWERYHVYQDKPVAVTLPDGRTQYGVARGVGDDGALLFEQNASVRRLHSGELRLRALPGNGRSRGGT